MIKVKTTSSQEGRKGWQEQSLWNLILGEDVSIDDTEERLEKIFKLVDLAKPSQPFVSTIISRTFDTTSIQQINIEKIDIRTLVIILEAESEESITSFNHLTEAEHIEIIIKLI